uniref:Uncharacterized protein n=1 Tax=Pithovirus LCPAC403 TaxID=2506596 RepID=A0A481ZAV8_9VIRU|nr:MAG: hypothetical protein LCPAC403_00410 [Pithovirus LCPAC403]
MGQGHSIGYEEALVIGGAIVLVTAVGNTGIIFAFERNREKTELDVLWIVIIAFLVIFFVMFYVLVSLYKRRT